MERWRCMFVYLLFFTFSWPNSLPLPVGALYVQKHFKEGTRQAASDLVEELRNAFINTLKNVPWMGEKTREMALKKANLIRFEVGYQKELDNISKLEEYYKDLELKDDNFLLNTLRVIVFENDHALRLLHQPVRKDDWKAFFMPTTAGAFYEFSENIVRKYAIFNYAQHFVLQILWLTLCWLTVISAAILQGRIFSPDRPRYMNYGSLGFIIGHEITHGFDDQGRQHDFNGNLIDWWETETANQFLKRAQCIIEQYGNYTDPESHLSVNWRSQQVLSHKHAAVNKSRLIGNVNKKNYGRDDIHTFRIHRLFSLVMFFLSTQIYFFNEILFTVCLPFLIKKLLIPLFLQFPFHSVERNKYTRWKHRRQWWRKRGLLCVQKLG